MLEMSIGNALTGGSTADEGRKLVYQSAADLKRSLAKNPEDKVARFWVYRSLFYSGCYAHEAGQLEDALDYFEQTAVMQTEMQPSDSDGFILIWLFSNLPGLADRFGQSGRTEQAERSRQASQKIRRYLFGSAPSNSTDASPPGMEALSRLLERNDLKALSSSEDKGTRDVHLRFAAQWLPILVGPLSPFRSPSAAATFDRNPEAGAITLISAVRDLCSKLCIADTMVPAVIDSFRADAATAAHNQRQAVRLNDARATATCVMVLARRLVREYPESAHSYRILSEAHNQIRKNSIQTRDDKLVEEAAVQAIEAAQRALTLDPDQIETRRHLDKLTERLADFKADRHAPGSSLPK